MNSKLNKLLPLNLRALVILGFMLLFVLVVILVATGIYSMRENNNRLESTHLQQSAKLKLLVSMRDIARERVSLLFTAITYTDPFE